MFFVSSWLILIDSHTSQPSPDRVTVIVAGPPDSETRWALALKGAVPAGATATSTNWKGMPVPIGVAAPVARLIE